MCFGFFARLVKGFEKLALSEISTVLQKIKPLYILSLCGRCVEVLPIFILPIRVGPALSNGWEQGDVQKSISCGVGRFLLIEL